MIEDHELPDRWAWTKLANISQWNGGGTPSKAREEFWTGGNVPWVSPKDMKTFFITDTEDHLTSIALEEKTLKLCPPGTILVVVRSGILERTLPVAISKTYITMNQDMKGISPESGIDGTYLAYYLISAENDILSRCSKNGTTVASIESESLKTYFIPLAPTTEQQRIVAAIEQQFTRLDAGVAALKSAQTRLKRYRAAVLKAAVEGKLTEAWSAEHPTSEPASQLLTRILQERRTKWEADLRAKGKDPTKVKYVEPAMPDVSGLPELPEGWCWATISQVAECLDHQRIPINKEERIKRVGTIPYYGANGQVGWIDEYIFDEALVLIVEDETFIGREIPFSYKITGKTWVNNHAHVLRPTTAVDVDYLNYSLAHYPFTPLTQGTTGRRKLTQKALMLAPYALPPLEEQQQIVSEVERRLSVVSKLEAIVEANLKRAERLRQSILKEAFAGRLVEQDPDDEPASVLLERIRREREERGERGERGKQGKKDVVAASLWT